MPMDSRSALQSSQTSHSLLTTLKTNHLSVENQVIDPWIFLSCFIDSWSALSNVKCNTKIGHFFLSANVIVLSMTRPVSKKKIGQWFLNTELWLVSGHCRQNTDCKCILSLCSTIVVVTCDMVYYSNLSRILLVAKLHPQRVPDFVTDITFMQAWTHTRCPWETLITLGHLFYCINQYKLSSHQLPDGVVCIFWLLIIPGSPVYWTNSTVIQKIVKNVNLCR